MEKAHVFFNVRLTPEEAEMLDLLGAYFGTKDRSKTVRQLIYGFTTFRLEMEQVSTPETEMSPGGLSAEDIIGCSAGLPA
jgi:hypothetical protein